MTPGSGPLAAEAATAGGPVPPVVQVDLEWGESGARRFIEGEPAEVVVVVDVLSFSTSVTIAVERGARVWPHPGGEPAHELARSLEAILAGTRSHTSGPSLSPASLADLAPDTRLVLPSPNGSSIAHVLMSAPTTVLAGCLRNAGAVARAVLSEALRLSSSRASTGPLPAAPVRVGIVPAGESWGDGSLRVAYEDHVGAGAVIAHLRTLRPDVRLSPEALVAVLAFERLQPLELTPSGRELVERGFAQDVEIAEAVDASSVVPLLRNGSFTAA
jgi:2-phosphosulfolactate phosphatase